MDLTKECPVCKSRVSCSMDYDTSIVFYDCPVCGRYEITYSCHSIIDDNRLGSYLYYNRFVSSDSTEYRYHTTLSKEKCDEYKKDFEKGDIRHGHPVHFDEGILSVWYPKSFAERIDRILIKLSELSAHIGQHVHIGYPEILALLFIDRKEPSKNGAPVKWRDENECGVEKQYMLNVLKEQNLVDIGKTLNREDGATFVLTPAGYSRVDELQRNTASGRQVLVAMKFGDDTIPLREAIREGIENAGYNAVFIDEVPHNEFITPELLKHIRDSRFVVVDLTHQNNGAYFEEGYAMGLGKPVIQLCKKGTHLHFDIAQKNTIMWETENDIPLRLKNRIEATID